MGNKLAQPGDLNSAVDIGGYQVSSTNPGREQVLRLWVDLFNIREDGGSPDADLQWYKITDDVVPASITCIFDDPNTIYHIKAYNSQVEKICDVKLVQPGTKLKQPTESFIHFKDMCTDKHWGFNFTSAEDAAKFRDTVLTLTLPPLPKSSSFGTLRLGKKWKTGSARGSSSSSTQRSESHGAISSLRGGGKAASSKDISGIVTAPRYRQHQASRVDSRTLFTDQSVKAAADISGSVNHSLQDTSAAVTGQSNLQTHASITNRNDSGSDIAPPPTTDMYREGPSVNSVISTSSLSSHTTHTIQEEVLEGEAEVSDPDVGDDSDYDKPATLSAAHLNAILFSCENIASQSGSTDTKSPQRRLTKDTHNKDTHTDTHGMLSATDTHETISEEDELDDTDMIENSPPEETFSPIQHDQGLRSMDITQDAVLPEDTFYHHHNDHITTDSTLHKMLQSLPDVSDASNSSFGKEAGPGDPSITAPIHSSPSNTLLRQPSNSSSVFRSSHQKRLGDDSYTHGCSSNLKPTEQVKSQGGEEDENNVSLYEDSGFGGTISTQKSASIESFKTRVSRQSSRISGSARSNSDITGTGSVCSSSSSSHMTKISDITQVKPFTFESDESEDDEYADSTSTHSFTTQPAAAAVTNSSSYTSSLTRTPGATRRAGWLEVKNWMMQHKKRLTLANKRHWKRYWVTLRGTTLMFYACDDQASLTEDALPRHVIYIDGSIAQSVPEHPKRENIFSVSSAYGDAYLFQAPTQIEHDNWIASIHSACASQHARQHGKTNPVKLLLSDIDKLQQQIDSDSKMKKMAELQLTVVNNDAKSRSAISTQIYSWEQNLECLYMDQFKSKCYLSSLQGSELPNPKTILSSMSRGTKHKLGKLGILNATSFHSLICVRTPNAYNTYIDRKHKKSILSTLRQNSSQSRLKVTADTFLPPAQANDEVGSGSGNCESEDGDSAHEEDDVTNDELANSTEWSSRFGDNLTRVLLPNKQTIVVATTDDMTVRDVLELVCDKRQLVLADCFLRIRHPKSTTHYTIPQLDDVFEKLDYESVEICHKLVFQLEMRRESADQWAGFGIEVEAELDDDAENEDEQRIFIDNVEAGSPAQLSGIIAGDELLTLNGQVISELDVEQIECILIRETHVRVTVRSCRVTKPNNNLTLSSAMTSHADSYIDNMMCPPPPSQNRISDRVIGDLIVPAPTWVQNCTGESVSSDAKLTPRAEADKHNTDIKGLLSSAEQVTHFCRMAHEILEPAGANPVIQPRSQPMSDAQKLRKVILELINTEKAYVRDLCMLMERYLEPLKEETFLTSEEVVRLVGNIQEIVHFQKEFLRNLEESVDDESFLLYTEADQFKTVLFSIAGSFIYYANHFKLYSSFCASHSRAQKVLSPGDNTELYEFLHARNPKQQHSSTLESYLIKPIQRILKYPLLLQQLRALTHSDSNENIHLSDALKAMESVAEHINEMQKIYEEFGTVFDDMTKSHTTRHLQSNVSGEQKRRLDLNVGDLQFYGEADWLNASDDISKPRKGWESVTTVFVFKHGVVLLCQEKLKGKSGRKQSGSGKGGVLSASPETVYTKYLPVTDIQVRTLPTTHSRGPVALWELLFLKSTSESRPEKIYHMACRDVEKRSEFLKHMRQIIRESVRRMTVPMRKTSAIPTDSLEVRLRHSNIEQTDSSSEISSVTSRPMRHSVIDNMTYTHTTKPDTRYDNRYSMNLDSEKLTLPLLDNQGGRSRTYGDLLDLNEGTALNHKNLSKTSLGSDVSQGSGAKLVFSSQDPLKYSTKGSYDSMYRDGGGADYSGGTPPSPVWQKRSVNISEDNSSSSEDIILPRLLLKTIENKGSLKIQRMYIDNATEC